MKKFLTINLLMIFLIMPFFSFAATPAGLTPKSPFYFLDTLFEKIGLSLTFNAEKRAEKALEYADERLAEAEEVATEQDTNAVKTALSGYEKNIAFAAEESKQVKDKDRAEGVFNLIADNAAKQQEVLANVLAKVPDEAKEAITRAIEASKRGQEEALKQISELKKEVEVLKQEVAELKKQRKIELAPPTNNQSQSSIQELKKEIEDLKKQAAIPAVPVTSATPAQSEVKAEEQMLILSNSYGKSYPIDNPAINRQRVQDLIDVGFFVTQGKLPEGIITKKPPSEIPPPTPAPVSTKPLEVILINVSSTNRTATFEWTTNKLSNAKIFLSGGSLSSNVYSSESGLSTRHIVHVSNLSANTKYSYEIETIADGEVIKKQGSFLTQPDVYIFKVQGLGSDYKIREDGTFDYKAVIALTYQTGENLNSLKCLGGVSINASIPLLNINQTEVTRYRELIQGDCTDSSVTFKIPVIKNDTYPVVFSANGATYNYNLAVTAIDNIKNMLCKDTGAFCESKDIAFLDMTPRIIKTLDNIQLKLEPRQVSFVGMSIGGFKIAGITNYSSRDAVAYVTSSIPLKFGIFGREVRTTLKQDGTIGSSVSGDLGLGGNNNISIGNYSLSGDYPLSPGIYTVTISDIKDVRGGETGGIKVFAGLPITFTFEVLAQ